MSGAASAAVPDVYLVAGLAHTSTEYQDLENGNGLALTAGYQWRELPLFVETEYYSSGTMEVERPDQPRLSYQGALAHLGYVHKLQEKGRIRIKGGVYALDSTLRLDGDYGREHTRGFSLGAGADWMFSNQWGLSADIETPFKAKSLPGLRSNESTQLAIFKIGFVWRPALAARRASDAITATSAAAAPSERPPPAVASSLPEPPSTPQPPVPTQTLPASPRLPVRVVAPLSAGMSATVRAGTKVLTRPKTDAPVDSTFTADSTVVINGSTYGSSGTWWYVRDIDHSGWVQGSELEPLQ